MDVPDKWGETMTLEELKVEAKIHGYTLIKIKEKERLLPCICGSNRRTHVYRGNSTDGERETLICKRCGRRAGGKDEYEARHNWNEMIRAEMENARTD